MYVLNVFLIIDSFEYFVNGFKGLCWLNKDVKHYFGAWGNFKHLCYHLGVFFAERNGEWTVNESMHELIWED